MIRTSCLLMALLATGCVHGAAVTADPPADTRFRAIPLDGFDDGIHHWQNLHGKEYPRHDAGQIVDIANNILLYQRQDGGWVENRDPARILNETDREQVRGESASTGGSFDNRNVYTQVEYLADAFGQTGDTRYRDAALKGLDFILEHQQLKCGGWPHTVPAKERYHPLITIADEVTPGVLATLRKVADGSTPFGFITPDGRERARAAVERGDACLLALQIRQDGVRTGWAGQYDPDSLLPVKGRSFELPSVVVQETVAVTRYLMSIPDPAPEIVTAIEAAVDWLQRVRIEGWRLETFQAEPEQYRHHSSGTDRRLVEDPDAPALWARFYDLHDNSVVLANREGERVARYSDIPRERRTGYSWYGEWPRSLLERDYPRWKKRLAAAP